WRWRSAPARYFPATTWSPRSGTPPGSAMNASSMSTSATCAANSVPTLMTTGLSTPSAGLATGWGRHEPRTRSDLPILRRPGPGRRDQPGRGGRRGLAGGAITISRPPTDGRTGGPLPRAVPRVVDSAINIRPSGVITSFSAGIPQDGGVGVINSEIVVGNPPQVLASAEGIEPAGIAGVLDACAAAAVAHAAGASAQAISAGLASYRVDAHRGEVVHKAAGIKFIDNSKATNPHAADAALAGLANVIWVAGGQLKGAEVDELIAAHHKQMKAVVLLGQDRDILARALKEHAPEIAVEVIEDTDGEEAMHQVVAAAIQHAGAGDTVLLAPAAASLDMYS